MPNIDYSSNVRTLKGRVKVYTGAGTQVSIFNQDLISFEVQRVAEDTKFFGQVVNQKVNLKLRANNTTFSTSRYCVLGLSNDGVEYDEQLFPRFYFSETHTDENTGEKSVTAYDWIKLAESATVNDLNITYPFTIEDFAQAIASYFGFSAVFINIDDNLKSLTYTSGMANLEGTESLKDCIGWIAEVLGATAYLGASNNLAFRCLSDVNNAIITKNRYFSLKSGDNKKLSKIILATELGDNIEAHITATGSTQIIRNNPFIDLRSDRQQIANYLINKIGGLTIAKFEMEWRGALYYEIGDNLVIAGKTENITSYLLDETITFDGGLTSKMRFYWDENKTEDESANPSTIGEVIYQTYAVVDKVNKEISLVVSDVSSMGETVTSLNSDLTTTKQQVQTNKTDISNLKITTSGLTSTVSSLETTTTTILSDINNFDTRNLLLNSAKQRSIKNDYSTYFLTDYAKEVYTGGKSVVLSFYAKSDENNTIIDAYPAYNEESPVNRGTNTNFFTVTNNWKRFSLNYTIPTGDYAWFRWRLRSNTSVTGGSGTATVLIKNVKLEMGTNLTAYTEAPEDYQERITTINENISSLNQTATDITATVSSTQETVADLKDGLQDAVTSTNQTISALQQQVSAAITSSDLQIAISEALSDGVDSVVTSTGYKFDKDGLSISRSNSDISTNIDNEGMRVSTQFEEVLTATNSGVNALNLTARNFLIIGARSRIQDYGADQTGIFWIGD